MTAPGARPRRLIVFARLPRLGRVKTRLASTVGVDAALAAYRRLASRTLSLVAALPVDCRELRIAEADPTPMEAETLDALRATGWRVSRQCSGDLGARMADALDAALSERHLPVLIGCDCPVLEVADLQAAFAALERDDAVFSPTEDGGYALVGIARPLPALFSGMPWGSAEVMERTRIELGLEQARWTELRTLWDVDVAADLERWQRIRTD